MLRIADNQDYLYYCHAHVKFCICMTNIELAVKCKEYSLLDVTTKAAEDWTDKGILGQKISKEVK